MYSQLPVTVLVIGLPLFSLTGGCSRRTVAPPVTEPPPTTISPTHRRPCTVAEVKTAACAVGRGRCYAVELQGETQSFCSCFDDWVGKRCQEKQIPLDWLESRSADQIRTAYIATGVSISVFIVIIALIAILVYSLRWRKKEQLLRDRQYEATAEELYRRPFSGRNSIVESISRAGSLRHGVPNNGIDVECENVPSQSQPLSSQI